MNFRRQKIPGFIYLLSQKSRLFTLFFLLMLSCDSKPEKTFVIGFSQCVDSDEWRQAMYFEMKKELAFYPPAFGP
jgi:hypothetical protein